MDSVMQETLITLHNVMFIEEMFDSHGLAFEPGPTSGCGTVAGAHTCYGAEYSVRKGDLVLGYGSYLDFEKPAENPAGFVWVSLTTVVGARQIMALNFSPRTGWKAEADDERLRKLSSPEERLLYLISGAELAEEQAVSSLQLMISVFMAHASPQPC